MATSTALKLAPQLDETMDLMFRNARSHNGWKNKPVDDAVLMQAYELAKWGPTSANMSPLRVVFVKSPEAKEKLNPALDKGNLEKTMTAPVTAIFGMDLHFYEHMDKLAPHNPAGVKSWFDKLPDDKLEYVALRNSSLQAAYFMLAARACGLDCGPMSGFNNKMVDEIFFAGTRVKSNFICALGYGDNNKLRPRAPRLEFNEACKIV